MILGGNTQQCLLQVFGSDTATQKQGGWLRSKYPHNELPYVNAAVELKRIDRLVEFDNEVWVLDYKLGDSEDAARHPAQMRKYQTAMQSVYAGKTVRCALLFVDGMLSEV